MALAWLCFPPGRVPRSVITPFFQRKACCSPSEVCEAPMTHPEALSPVTRQFLPPRVPRSIVLPWLARKAWMRTFGSRPLYSDQADCPAAFENRRKLLVRECPFAGLLKAVGSSGEETEFPEPTWMSPTPKSVSV